MIFLAASENNPLGHVVDEPLFHFTETDYGWQQAIAARVGEFFHHAYEHYGFGKHAFMFILSGVVTLLIFSARARRVRTETVPGRWGNALEATMLFLRDQVVRPFLGHHGDKYLPFTWAFFFFILVNNLLGLIPLFDYLGHGGNTATANIGLTAALAISSFVLYHILGIREQGGVWTYFKSIFPHVPWPLYFVIGPVEILAHIVRPCALAIRLCANMIAGHTLIAAILMFTSMALKLGFLGWSGISIISCLSVVALTFLELLVAFIQAFVFTFLSTVFLSMAVHPEH